MRKHSFSILFTLFIVPVLAGCSLFNGWGSNKNNNNNDSGDNNNTNITPSATFKINDPNYSFVQRNSKEEVTFDDLFNLNNRVEITIDVDKSEMQKINDDNVYGGDFDSIKPETYHLAKKFTLVLHNGSKEFKWELENVGIRQKGNTSRKPIFTSSGDIYNKNHFKISFDETFKDKNMYDSAFIAQYGNKDYKDREILGLSGLDIKWNKIDDSTHLKEIYSNMILRSAGIMAQHIGLATMKMNYDGGKVADFGLCSIYEPSSKSFIKRSLSSGESYINMPSWETESKGTYGVADKKYGDLYKASYGKGDGANNYWEGATFKSETIQGKRIGVKTDIAGYNWPIYERKTNTGDEYDDTLMKELVTLLNKSSTTYEQIAEKVDLQNLAMEEAVMYFLGSPDAMRYNYNNYLVYFRRTDGKLVIIPIDNDRCFGIGNGWTDGLNFILSNDAKPNSSKSKPGDQRNPLLKKTIFASGNNQVKADYQACLELVKNSAWLKNETFERYYNILKETYNGLSTFSLNGGKDNISFSSYVEKKLNLYNGGTSSGTVVNGGSNTTENEPLFPANTTLYLVGTFDEWATTDGYNEDYYILRPTSNGKRQCIFRVPAHNNSSEPIKMKIYGGKAPNPAWTYDYGVDGNDHIAKNNPDDPVAKIVFDADVGDLVRFIVNEETGEYTVEVAKNNELAYFDWSTQFKVMCSSSTDFFEGNAELASDGTYKATINFNRQEEMTFELSIFDMGNFYFYKFDNTGKIIFAGPYMEGCQYVKEYGKTSLTVTINRLAGTITFE